MAERKKSALLPNNDERDGPLFFVMTIIVFLASLSAVSAAIAVQSVAHWKQALRSEMTVQVKNGNPETAQQAVEILRNMAGVKSAYAGTREEAKQLLEPWLGSQNIPDDLPIPVLVYVQLEDTGYPDSSKLSGALAGAGLNISVDDHQRWAKALSRSAQSVQLLSVAVLALLFTAMIAITGFATRAGLAAHKDLVEVLHLVGAKDRTIARLFGQKFIILGLKSGAFGAGLAAISIAGLIVGGVGASSFMQVEAQVGFGQLWVLLLVPLVMAIVGGWTAHYSVLNNLRKHHQ